MDHLHQVLLSLHYCWFLDRLQLHRLHFPELKPESVKPILTRLQDDGLIEQVRWARSEVVTSLDPETGEAVKQKLTRPRHSMWWLTAKGIRLVEGLPNALHDDPGARPRQVYAHDKRTLDTIVTVIERARETGLCGIRLFREEKLNPHAKTVKRKERSSAAMKATKPIMDALLIFEVGGSYSQSHPNLVPWSLDKPLTDSTLWRVAIEADNDTEPPPVIIGKAHAYQRVLSDPVWRDWWTKTYGPQLPHVLWVVPSQARADEIQACWQQAWPGGDWWVTTDEGMRENRWVRQRQGMTVYKHPLRFPTVAVQHDEAQRLQRHREAVLAEQRAAAEQERHAALQRKRDEDARWRQLELDRQAAEAASRERETALQLAREAEAAAEAQRVREEQERLAATQAALVRRERRLRLIKPWWWAWWLGCGSWWLARKGGWALGWMWFETPDGPNEEWIQRGLRWAMVAALVWGAWQAGGASFVARIPQAFGLNAEGTSAAVPPACGSVSLRVTSDALNLRQAPNADAPIVRTLPRHAVLRDACMTDGAWRKVAIDAAEGWVHERYVETVPLEE